MDQNSAQTHMPLHGMFTFYVKREWKHARNDEDEHTQMVYDDLWPIEREMAVRLSAVYN